MLNYFKDHIEGQLDFWGFNTDIKVSSSDLDHFEKGTGDCCDLFKRMIDKVALTTWRVMKVGIKFILTGIFLALIILAFMEIGSVKSENSFIVEKDSVEVGIPKVKLISSFSKALFDSSESDEVMADKICELSKVYISQRCEGEDE